jgi:hypothetical protein
MAASDRRRWWHLFAALTMATSAWALVSPLMAGHDEGAHAVRGAAVVRGQMYGTPAPEAFPPEPNVLIRVEVPEAYLLVGREGCFNRQRHLTPECAPAFTGGRDTERVLTYQFRSPPTYYAAVAWPSLLDTGSAGVYGMRLVSGALCSALLASALVSARAARRSWWTVLGVAVAISPEVLYLAGSINSNAVEVAAAIGLWSALLAVVRHPGPAPDRLVARAGLALVVLVGTRGLSPLFGGFTVLAAGLLLGRVQVRALLRRPEVRWWGVAAAVMSVGSLAYIEWVRRQLPIERPGQGLSAALDKLPWYLRQGVGIFGSNDIPLPDAVYWAWGGLFAVLIALGLVLARRPQALVLLAVLAAGIGVQIGAEGFSLPPIGFFWQGRYALPLLVGVPIVASSIVSEAEGRWTAIAERLQPVAIPLLVVAGLAQLASFLQAVRRFAVTLDGPGNPVTYLFSPRWSPATAPAPVWVAMFAAALVASGWLALRRSSAA